MGRDLERDRGRTEEAGRFAIPGFLPGDHAFFPYQGDGDRDEGIVAYVREGLVRGERCICAAPPPTLARLSMRLDVGGIDVARAVGRGALWLRPADEVYRSNGSVDIEGTIAFVGGEIDRALGDGFTGLRGTGELTFPIGEHNRRTAHDYECRINDAFAGRPFTGLCAYARAGLTDDIGTEMLCTHPVAFLDGARRPNPFFAGPSAPPTAYARPAHPNQTFGSLLSEILDGDRAGAHQRDRLHAVIAEAAALNAAGQNQDRRSVRRDPSGEDDHDGTREPPRLARAFTDVRRELKALRRQLRDGAVPPARDLLTAIERIWNELRRASDRQVAPEPAPATRGRREPD